MGRVAKMRERDSKSYMNEMDGSPVLFLGPQATLEMRHEEIFLFRLHCFFVWGGRGRSENAIANSEWDKRNRHVA